MIAAASPSRHMRRGLFRRAFTLMETLVLIAIAIVLLSIFIPYLGWIRESSRRITCADNLRQIRNALQNYARDNNGDFPRVVYDQTRFPEGYAAFTGPDADDPFAENSPVKPSDVTASLWLLVRCGYINDTRVFICPSTSDFRDVMTDASGRRVEPRQRGNFRGPRNLSYSYASPFSSAAGFRMNDTKPGGFALMADKNPGRPAAMVAPDSSPRDLAKANSPNHRGAGQNVLYADGSVGFIRTPYCGSGGTTHSPGDNIYTARAARPATQPAHEVHFAVVGVVGRVYSPVSNDDSYLVPTIEDGFSPQP